MAFNNMEDARPRVTRKQANALGLKRYFTGKPCPHGHIAERLTDNGACVECARLRSLDWKDRNREHVNEYAREYAASPLPAEVKRAKDRERNARHPGRTSAQSRQWRLNNPEKAAENRREWKRDNRDKVNASERRRYAKDPSKSSAKYQRRRDLIAECDESFTDDDIAEIRRLQGDRCAICSILLGGKGTIDHIVALSRGGANSRRNIQLLCKPCNGSKKDDDQIEFMRRKYSLLL